MTKELCPICSEMAAQHKEQGQRIAITRTTKKAIDISSSKSI